MTPLSKRPLSNNHFIAAETESEAKVSAEDRIAQSVGDVLGSAVGRTAYIFNTPTRVLAKILVGSTTSSSGDRLILAIAGSLASMGGVLGAAIGLANGAPPALTAAIVGAAWLTGNVASESNKKV